MFNIVVRRDGWVLEWLARSFAEHMGKHVEVRLSEDADLNAKANIYFPYYLYDGPTDWDVCYFTHREMGDDANAQRKARKFDEVGEQAHVCWAQSEKTAALLPHAVVIPIPVDPIFERRAKLTLGVCGMMRQPFGRKCPDWIERLSEIEGVRVVVTDGKYGFKQLPDWYSGIDYLLVLSTNEGGPFPVKEAIAMGKPVMAPDVGWAWDYPVIRYSGYEHLERIIKQLAPKESQWPKAAEALLELCTPREAKTVIHPQIQAGSLG